jgi:hypothetical protein
LMIEFVPWYSANWQSPCSISVLATHFFLSYYYRNIMVHVRKKKVILWFKQRTPSCCCYHENHLYSCALYQILFILNHSSTPCLIFHELWECLVHRLGMATLWFVRHVQQY